MKKLSWPAAQALCLLVLLSGTGVSAALAQSGYPAARDPYVNDFAGRLLASERQNLGACLRQAHEKTGAEVTVVVVRSIHDYATNDASIESFATHLFNEWGVGDAERKDGVLFLVAMDDRQVRIELGSGYGAYNDDLVKRVLDQHVLPRFREGHVAEGIDAGVRATLLELLDYRPPAPVSAPVPSPSAASRPASKRRSSWPVGRILLGLVVLGGAGLGGRAIYRYRRCPECGHRSIVKESKILSLPNGLSIGRREIVWRCVRCDYARRQYERLTIFSDPRSGSPQRGHSSSRDDSDSGYSFPSGLGLGSSSGDSSSHREPFSHGSSGGGSTSSRPTFGGGSSSGGGATGSW